MFLVELLSLIWDILRPDLLKNNIFLWPKPRSKFSDFPIFCSLFIIKWPKKSKFLAILPKCGRQILSNFLKIRKCVLSLYSIKIPKFQTPSWIFPPKNDRKKFTYTKPYLKKISDLVFGLFLFTTYKKIFILSSPKFRLCNGQPYQTFIIILFSNIQFAYYA